MSIGQESALAARRSLDEDRAKALSKAGLSLSRLIRELKPIALSCITDYVTVAEDGSLAALPTDTIKKGKLPAIKKIKEHTRITESAKGDMIWKDSRVEYELHDKLSAITTLLKLHGAFPAEKQEITGLNGGPIEYSRLDRANRIAAIADAARKRKAQGGTT